MPPHLFSIADGAYQLMVQGMYTFVSCSQYYLSYEIREKEDRSNKQTINITMIMKNNSCQIVLDHAFLGYFYFIMHRK